MNNSILNIKLIFVLLPIFLISCEDFFNPEQGVDITEDELYDDWYEYRSVEMGMYGLQQDLVEQIVILGELRGDLLSITSNADPDMIEIYNFNISKDNQYASPTNFFRLIKACNNFIRILKEEHPEVLDPKSPITNYDRLYGEALCMRAWTYFMAVRIYGKVPYIPESLVTDEEIGNFINTPGTYIDSVYINFSKDGYYNDTIYNQPITLERNLYDQNMIIDKYTEQLENEIKAVGVNHYIDNGDNSWEITIWNEWARQALLGIMYLTRGDLSTAKKHIEQITLNNSEDNRYQLDNTFSYGNWAGMFANINNKEHIFILPFDKSYQQQNDFQKFFINDYMLCPSQMAIDRWETVWRGFTYKDRDDNHPEKTELDERGNPGDDFRGYGISYIYSTNTGNIISYSDNKRRLILRGLGDDRAASEIIAGTFPVVSKYFIGNSSIYDQDANFPIYRAASIQLYWAEIYTYLALENNNGTVSTINSRAIGILNDGGVFSETQSSLYVIEEANRPQLGVRGRVGLGSGTNKITTDESIIYTHDPYTNEVIGYRNLSNNLPEKQKYLEEQILDERARELAFEGERFYDLMRVAKRRNDPSFLAKIVSSKFPEGQKEYIYSLLLDENNWYIHYFE